MQTTDYNDFICRLRDIDYAIIIPTICLTSLIVFTFLSIILYCLWTRLHNNIKNGKYKDLIPVQEVYVVQQDQERGTCSVKERKRLDPRDSIILA